MLLTTHPDWQRIGSFDVTRAGRVFVDGLELWEQTGLGDRLFNGLDFEAISGHPDLEFPGW